MSEPQWPGDAGPGQQFGPPGLPPGGPYGPPPGYPYGPSPGQSYGPPPGYPHGPLPGQSYGPPPGYPYGPSPGYPYGPPPGQFGPWGYLPPGVPPRSRRKDLWALGIIAVVLAVVVTGGFLVRHLGPGGSEPKSPTASARELLVSQSDFPKLAPPARFSITAGNGGEDPDLGAVNVSPPECKDVLGDTDATADTARAELSNAGARGGDGPRGYTVRVTKSAEPHYLDNLRAAIDKCESVSVDRDGVRVDGTVKPLTVTDTPVPVTGAAAKFVSTAYGVKVAMTMQIFAAVVRGTSVEVTSKRMSINSAKDFDTPDKGAVGLVAKQVGKIAHAN